MDFKLSTFCLIWKLPIFTRVSILNFFISSSSQIFIKTKTIKRSKTIVFDPYYIFVLINVCLLWLIKKFNMDILVKIGSFQIKQNVLNLKSTLINSKKQSTCSWLHKKLTADIFVSHISKDVGSGIGPRSSLVKYTKQTSNGWNQSVILST